MKTLFYIIGLVLLFLNLGFAQNRKNGDVSETKPVKDFIGIHSSLNADIYLTQADSFSFKIEARNKVIRLLETEVVNGILKIKLDRDSDIWDNFDKATIHISAPSFEQMDFSGAGKIKATNRLKGHNLDIVVSGTNSLEINDTEYDSLSLELSGVGNIEMMGKVHNAYILLSGTGNIDVMDLVIQNAQCDISGLGNLSCNVENVLNAEVSGMGRIKYKGEPKAIKKTISGLGKVRRD
jgi:Putative auto-transporter adhesin, head GIN domain